MPTIRFQEVQKFPGWMRAVLFATYVLTMGVLVAAFWNDESLGPSDWTIIGMSTVVTSFATLLIEVMQLRTVVDEGGVEVRLRPFVTWRVGFGEIAEAAPRTYRPIAEYGGWGWRQGFGRGWAYTVRGNRGVQFVTTGGRRVLVGSERSEELAEAVGKGMEAAKGR